MWHIWYIYSEFLVYFRICGIYFRICGMPEMQDMKLITPVRRSARIERAVARYPEMLQDHDVVVASLNELLEVDKTEYFVFRENEALPVTLGFEILES